MEGVANMAGLANAFSGIDAEVLTDPFSRGRYATDASIYQIMPQGAILPRSMDGVRQALDAARREGVPVTARGGGTSQCGQTVNHGLIVDNSKHLNRILSLDVENRRCTVEPGIVLDDLNRALKPHGLWFPVDVSTASRATIGGMAGNNSCGGRSLRYGTMRHNVASMDVILADGTEAHFGEVNGWDISTSDPLAALKTDLLELGARDAALINARFPKLNRRVGGYNIDALVPSNEPNNLAHLLVGSEGTLAYTTAVELKLWPLVGQKVMGVCHFPSFYAAMDAAQHIVALSPLAVELIDDTMIGLARDIAMFRPTVEAFVRGDPKALLVVEFDEGSQAENLAKLLNLEEAMGDLGFAFSGEGPRWGGVVTVTDQKLQADIGEVRKSGLNIMMSMKSEGKPVSFVEDCAVELKDLAEYTAGLNEIFERHGTSGTFYAHASVGCLHVRPMLNMKLDKDVKTMRAIAEETFALVASYKGSHSGEHGDGIVRSEFHEKMFGREMVDAFQEVKQRFDPTGFFNPGKIVDPPKMDDRRLFRFQPGYAAQDVPTHFDWSAYSGAGGGFQGAVEMCNNNGACRKLKGGVMCPSYRATRNERDATRGRANTLRLALSGQLGDGALTSDEMAETMKLCVGCKACKRECPTSVDMAKMKIEVEAARVEERGLTLHQRLVGYLPAYAPFASRLPGLANLRNRSGFMRRRMAALADFAPGRALPEWSAAPYRDGEATADAPDVILFADTFNRYFEPENVRAAQRVLAAGGVNVAAASGGGRPLCCGRTYLSAGLVERAKREAERTVAALLPHVEAGRPIVGLEPSCLITLRDEVPSLLRSDAARKVAEQAKMLEEYVAEASADGRLSLPLKPAAGRIMLHGHCHQKADGVMPAVAKALALIPDSEVETIETSCCGMAGSFGYHRDTEEVSRAMAEISLLPAVRAAPSDAIIVADGTSCRHQIEDGAGRGAIHVARLLDACLA